MKKAIIIFLLFSSSMIVAQENLATIQILTSGTNTSLRGLSVVNDEVIWVCGSHGMVGKSIDGGINWKWHQVKNFDTADFRDVEAFDSSTAIIMKVGDPASILRTDDGGENWKIVYENKAKEMFLDAMEFWNRDAGIVIGDPINHKIFIARTFDGGNTWKEIPENYRPRADNGEACFAASGTNVRALDRDEAVFVTGGLSSHIFIRNQRIKLPIVQGNESTGANSVAVWDNKKLKGGKKIIVVGGDFRNDTVSINNCFYSNDRGLSWQAPLQPPYGYKSCVEYITEKMLISCGTRGVDVSNDGGNTWKQISKDGFHVCRKAKDGSGVYLAGSNGRIARLME